MPPRPPRRLPRTLAALLACPTAPFREQAVVDFLQRWARRAGAEFRQDGAGNVLLRCHAGAPRRSRWVLQAHMDHPAFVVAGPAEGGRVWAEFRGGVLPEYFRAGRAGARIRLFAPGGELVARLATAQADATGPFPRYELAGRGVASVPPGTVGMWDFPPAVVKGDVLSARGCDDIVGVAAALCAAERARRRKNAPDVTLLLTRAEEVGFVGATAAARDGSLPRGAWVLGIETSSAAAGGLSLGDGVVLRAGDRWRTFDAGCSAVVATVAEKLAKTDKQFRFIRRLMPGGVCESSSFNLLGVRSAAVCVPLGNYHNMGPAGRVGPEQIHLDDFDSLVKLLAAVLVEPTTPAQADAAQRRLVNSRYRKLKRFL